MLGVFALVSACDRKAAPTGQVVARINGSEVTTSELQAEIAAAGVEAKAVAPQVLQSVIARKIVAAEARRAGLNMTPEYLALSQRADEVILGQQLINRWARDAPTPSDTDIAAEVSANPQRYERREAVALDQLALTGKLADAAKLAPLHSMADVVAYLDSARVKYLRGQKVIDSSTLSPKAFHQLITAPPGEPLIEVQPQGALISVITAREARPLIGTGQIDAAVNTLKREAIEEKIARLKAGIEVIYQPGYAPPKSSVSPQLQK